MRIIYIILAFILSVCFGCEWHLRSEFGADRDAFVKRYDRMEAFYLTSGDVSALQQMQTQYPEQTRLLIEDVLQLGKVDDSNINTRFYSFFQDTTLQQLISEVGRQYGDMKSLDDELSSAFKSLLKMVPGVEMPVVYTQIGSLDQSVVIGDGLVGVSLDKYLGADYPLYIKYGYTERQRSMMTQEYIVPDCLGFYLLSLFPCPHDSLREQHMGRIQYVVNNVLHHSFFTNDHVLLAKRYMTDNHLTYKELLEHK